jgi:hypothetical protein
MKIEFRTDPPPKDGSEFWAIVNLWNLRLIDSLVYKNGRWVGDLICESGKPDRLKYKEEEIICWIDDDTLEKVGRE